MREKTYTRWVWNEELQDDQLVEYGTGKYHFDEEDKIAIVSEYVGGHVPASQIIESITSVPAKCCSTGWTSM